MSSNTQRRWGDRPPAGDDESAALAALLNESDARIEKKTQDQNKGRPLTQRPHEPRGDSRGRWDNNGRGRGNGRDDRYRPPHERGGRYGDKPIVEDDRERSGHKRRRRWNDKDPEGPERWGEDAAVGNTKPEEEGEGPEKVKADFGLSGALATDTKTGNVRNGGTSFDSSCLTHL